jgi:UTP--glucose-1-phosphate uridylyltransferase
VSAAARVRKAVLPVAGLGTRFLPASKAQPKEMFPLVDKPLIQYAVEEAVASGLEEIILVTSRDKESIEEHFDTDEELEAFLESRGKSEEAALVRQMGQLANVVSVRQKRPLGLGHAVRCARELVGEEPFVVLLPDNLIDSEVPCTRQLLEVHARTGGSVVATLALEGEGIEEHGVLAVEPVADQRFGDRLLRVTDMVEKPAAAEAPSRFVIIGRYVLEPEIFGALEATPPGRNGEIQLTDALRTCARQNRVHAYRFEGDHFDAGNKLGFLRASVHYALRDPALGREFRSYLKSLKL